MKTLIKTTAVLLFGFSALLTTTIVSAATYSTANGSGEITAVADGYLYMNTTDGTFTDTTAGPDETYLIVDAVPNAVSGAHLQDALNAIGSSFVVTDFTSSGGNTYADLTSNGSFTAGSFDPNFLFEGFMVKSGNQTLVGLFDTAISEVFWNTLWNLNNNQEPRAMSHIAFFNTSPIPVPAALWLFAPALMGLLGIRKRYSA